MTDKRVQSDAATLRKSAQPMLDQPDSKPDIWLGDSSRVVRFDAPVVRSNDRQAARQAFDDLFKR